MIINQWTQKIWMKDSNEARILFAMKDSETVLQSICNQIEILQNAN
jgi:hypothetical protein